MFKRYGPRNPHNEFKSQWSSASIEEKIQATYFYPEIYNAIIKYLNTSGKIIEAGCGLGGWVSRLHNEGYNITGVDFVEDIIVPLKKHNPKLSIEVGDCTNLKYNDNSFDLYLSFGVIEHLEDGPDAFLKEAYRILKPNGYGLISVPNFDCLIHKNKPNNENHKEFFQYEFTKDEFVTALTKNNFEVIEIMPYGYFGYLYSKIHLRGFGKYRLNIFGKRLEKMYQEQRNWKYGPMQLAIVKSIK